MKYIKYIEHCKGVIWPLCMLGNTLYAMVLKEKENSGETFLDT